jgi:hypothetical protein
MTSQPDSIESAINGRASKQTAGLLNRETAWLANPQWWIVLSFAVSRLAYYLVGIRFQTRYLSENFQFIDLALLRTRLWESLFYFHMQPPLQNALVGILVKAFPVHYGGAMHILFVAMGLGSSLLIFRLMQRLQVATRLALALTIAFTVSPGTVLWENFPSYEYPMMFLLLSWVAIFHKLIERPSFWLSFGFFGIFACLGWIRALYHLYFMLASIPLIAWFVGRNRKGVAAGAIVPCLLVLGLYVKNLEVFGFFGASSWFGFANATCTIHQLSPDQREALISRGLLLPIARVEAPSLVPEYAPYVSVKATGIPVLDDAIKSDGGLNTNNMVYLKADPLYRQASRQVLANAPQAYLQSVVIAWFCYFLPPTSFFQFAELRQSIQPFDRLVNIVVFGQFHETTGKGLRALKAEGHTLSLVLYTGSFLIVVLPLLLCWSMIALWRAARREGDKIKAGLIAFILGNILFVMLTTNFLSSFENNRYRFPTDCLYLILLATFLQSLSNWRAAKRPTF